MNFIIRKETPSDYREVENLIRESFWNVYRPGCLEHYVLHCLRDDPAFVPELGFVMEKDPHGMPMGGMEGLRYKEAKWKLNPGDMLFLYTDGVPEANNSMGELFGNGRMLSSLAKSKDKAASKEDEAGRGSINLKQFLRLVRVQIDDFVGDTPQFDDLTMLAIKRS